MLNVVVSRQNPNTFCLSPESHDLNLRIRKTSDRALNRPTQVQYSITFGLKYWKKKPYTSVDETPSCSSGNVTDLSSINLQAILHVQQYEMHIGAPLPQPFQRESSRGPKRMNTNHHQADSKILRCRLDKPDEPGSLFGHACAQLRGKYCGNLPWIDLRHPRL